MYDLKGGYNLTGVVISGSMWKTVDKVPFFSYLSVLLILGMLAFLSLNAIACTDFFWWICMDFGGLDADVSHYAGESE